MFYFRRFLIKCCFIGGKISKTPKARRFTVVNTGTGNCKARGWRRDGRILPPSPPLLKLAFCAINKNEKR